MLPHPSIGFITLITVTAILCNWRCWVKDRSHRTATKNKGWRWAWLAESTKMMNRKNICYLHWLNRLVDSVQECVIEKTLSVLGVLVVCWCRTTVRLNLFLQPPTGWDPSLTAKSYQHTNLQARALSQHLRSRLHFRHSLLIMRRYNSSSMGIITVLISDEMKQL